MEVVISVHGSSEELLPLLLHMGAIAAQGANANTKTTEPVVTKTATPRARRSGEPIEKEKSPEPTSTAPANTATAVAEPTPAPATTAPPSGASALVATPQSAITSKLASAKGVGVVKKLLESFGVAKAQHLKPEQVQDYITKANALLVA